MTSDKLRDMLRSYLGGEVTDEELREAGVNLSNLASPASAMYSDFDLSHLKSQLILIRKYGAYCSCFTCRAAGIDGRQPAKNSLE